MNVKVVKITIGLLVWLLLMGAATAFYFVQWLHSPHELQHEEFIYTVKKGASLYAVANELQAKGVLRWPKVWVWYARLNQQTQIKTGEFKLLGHESPVEILQKLLSSAVVTYQVTLVEGSQFKEILQRLHEQEKLVHKLQLESALTQLQEVGVEVEHLEGWFFPDTYQFVAGDSDIDILLRSYKRMQSVLEQEWAARSDALPYETPYEALIMASIVEKETGVAYERQAIAGVFVRRLQRNMRLQTDPTVIYGMGDAYQGNIRYKDLRKPTPYNTYVIFGLPPTPIAMPGREAIYAALHPADGEALYFVAKGDGTHHFSATNEEHANAVIKYQKKRRADYRSYPAKSPATESGESDER